MPNVGPYGTLVDLNIIQKKIGQLKKLIGNNKVAAFKTLSTTIVSNYASVNTLIQAVTSNANELPADPTLSILL